jgi:hypothetical protein
MAFKFRCPKCSSISFSIERDNRVFTPNLAFELIFSCRCGKQLFGDQIDEEYARQQKVHEVSVAEKAAKEKERRTRIEAETGSTVTSRNGAATASVGLRHEDDVVVDTSNFQVIQHELYGEVKVDGEGKLCLPEGHEHRCEWHPCAKPRRPNSKYCSRNCSNKNARWRHKQRKGSSREAA